MTSHGIPRDSARNRPVWLALFLTKLAIAAFPNVNAANENLLADAVAALESAEYGGKLPGPHWQGGHWFLYEPLHQPGSYADLMLKPSEWEFRVVGGLTPATRAISARRLAEGIACFFNVAWGISVEPDGERLASGAVYELSALARSLHPGATLRLWYHTGIGGRGIPVSFGRGRVFSPGTEFERFAVRFEISDEPGLEDLVGGTVKILVGNHDPMAEVEVLVTDIVLKQIDEAQDYIPSPTLLEDPDPVQGLDAFMEREGRVSGGQIDEIERGRSWLTRRVIFNDRKYGAEVWNIGGRYCHTASVWPAWNADGSLLYHTGGIILWCRDDPDIYYNHTRPVSHNARTGERKTVANPRSTPGQRIYGFTRCKRYLFMDTPNGGIWLPYEPGDEPIGFGPRYDGRPAKPNPDGTPYHPFENADNYESWLTAGGSIWRVNALKTEFGPLIRVRVGKLIDRESGEIENIIAPMSAFPAYLRTYMGENGRILFPETPDWENHRIMTADTVEELFEIYRYLPHCTHGHSSRSPCDEFEADDTTMNVWNIREGKLHSRPFPSPTGFHYHLHWVKHPRFFVGWVRGTLELRRKNAGLVYQGFSDGTWQPVFDSKHRPATGYHSADFSMQSPDATKIHLASNMTGDMRNYVAVMSRPRPPRGIRWEPAGGAIELSWTPPALHREIKGYLVYRSERSGGGYELLTSDPVQGTRWVDEDVEPGEVYYYVATAVEHSELESGYSEEAARAGIGLPERIDDPLVIYAEAENALWDLPTAALPGLAMGRDVQEASDWYYTYLHPDASNGGSALELSVPAAGEYNVWARIRSAAGTKTGWTLGMAGNELAVQTDARRWTWVKAGRVGLAAGRSEVNISTSDRGAEIDIICLAGDAGFVPEGPRPENTRPPAPPADLHTENVLERTNRLEWEASPDPTVVFYNVYASRAPFSEPAQEHRIGSPAETEFIDSELRAGERYHYAVTAVDRRRNESEPVFAEAFTPPDPDAE